MAFRDNTRVPRSRRLRRVAVAAAGALLVGTVAALVAPVAAPSAQALTNVQNGVEPSVPSCQDARLHTFFTIATCNPVDVTSRILVNGADVASNHELQPGDVVSVNVTVGARGGDDAMYTETIDAIRNSYYDIDAVVPVTLPTQTGTLLSAPTNISMSRTDIGSRGIGPLINCWLQSGEDAPRSDANRSITLGAAPVGASGMKATVAGTSFQARWTTMTADRCVTLLSNNGFYAGHSVQFSQTVIGRGASTQDLVWTTGGIQLAMKDGSRSLTWGNSWSGTMRVSPANVPSAPLIGAVTAGNAQATVSWTPPQSDGGSPVVGYTVTPFIGEVAQTPRVFFSTSTTQTIGGLTNGTAYRFKVAAFNTSGTGAQSGPSDEVMPVAPATVPGAPTIGTATAGDTTATVTWTAPSDPGGAPITGYTITPYLGGTALFPQTFTSTATSQVVTGLTNGASYSFRVAAINSFGTGPRSASSNAVTPRAPATVPGAPTIGTPIAGNGQVSVYWSPPASDGGAPITSHVIRPYIGGVAQTPIPFPSTASPQVVTGLTNGTTYTFTVAAVNEVGTGPESAQSSAVTPSAVNTRPGPPTNVAATAAPGQATVSWTAPSDDGGLAISGYVVTPFIGTSAQTPRTFSSTATTQTVTGLVNGTTYTFKVAATNALGTGGSSASSNPVTPTAAATVPGAPTGVSGTAADQRVNLSWTAPASTGGSPLTGYVVTPYIGATAQTPRVFTSTATSQAITGLTNGTGYRFRVAATNAVGTSAQSSLSSTITPFGPVAPAAPTIGSARAGDASATVSWNAPTSNGGSPITGYNVVPYIGATAQTARFSSGDGTSLEVTGLTNGTAYSFRVAAVNAIGASPLSASSNVVTPVAPATPPGAPTIGAVTAGDGQATVTWSAPASDGGSPIVGYAVTPSVGGVPQAAVGFASTATSQVVTGLTNGTTYTFTVRALNEVGPGPESASSASVTPGPPVVTMSGTVRDGNGVGIVGVKVRVPGRPEATTDATGAYSVTGIAPGTYTVQVEGVCRAPVSRSVTVPGPAPEDFTLGGFGSCSVDAAAWDTTTTPLALTGDDASLAVTLPFTYRHAGADYSTAHISTNGVVSFLGADTAHANTAIPTPGAPNAAIYGFWDNLVVDSSSTVLANTFGSAPNRRFVIEWRNVTLFADTSRRFSFQVVLYERTTERVRLQYRDVTAGTAETGTGATVGTENAAGSGGTQVLFDNGLLYDGLSIRPK